MVPWYTAVICLAAGMALGASLALGWANKVLARAIGNKLPRTPETEEQRYRRISGGYGL